MRLEGYDNTSQERETMIVGGERKQVKQQQDAVMMKERLHTAWDQQSLGGGTFLNQLRDNKTVQQMNVPDS